MSFSRPKSANLLEGLRRPALFLVFLAFVLTIFFYVVDIRAAFEPRFLSLALYLVFVIFPGFFIAAATARSFLRTGSWPALWLGAGTLTFALGTLIGSWLVAVSSSNIAVTASNIIYLAAGALHLFGGFFVINRVGPQERSAERTGAVLQVYLALLLFITFVTLVSARGLLPVFFVPGSGGTPLRQMIVGTASLFFLVSSIMVYVHYIQTRAGMLFWYALGLLLLFLGMVGVMMQSALGTPLNWTGRGAQLLAGAYLVLASLTVFQEARARQVPAGEVIAGFFKHPAANLKLLFDSVHDAIIVFDRDFRGIEWNRAAENIYGWKAEEIIGRVPEDILQTQWPPETTREQVRDIVEEKGVWQGELVQKHRDGRELVILSNISLLRDKSGKVIGRVAINRDITERKKAEAETAYLATFPEMNPNPIIELDRDGNITYMNPAAQRLFPDVQTMGSYLTGLMSLLEGEPTLTLRRDVQVGDFWYKQTISPVPSTQNLRIYGSDITERRRFEEELKKANEELEERVRRRTEEVSGERQRLYTVLETLPAYVVLMDKDYRVPFANRFFRERFGESHGQRCFEFLFHRSEACENCESYKVMETKGPHHWVWLGPDGRNYDIYDYPFVDTDGSLTILEMGIDVTERKQAEEEMRKLSRRLVQVQEEERRFFARELHDQVGQMLTYFSMLLDRASRAPPEKVGSLLEEARGAAKDLISQVRNLSLSLRPTLLDDMGLVPALDWMVQRFTSDTNIKIDFQHSELPRGIAAEVNTAAFRIIQEALTNVARHAGVSQAALSVWLEGDRLCVQVLDQGKGFAAGVIPPGVGLSAMRERAVALSGELQIESAPGAGTRVTAKLPFDRKS